MQHFFNILRRPASKCNFDWYPTRDFRLALIGWCVAQDLLCCFAVDQHPQTCRPFHREPWVKSQFYFVSNFTKILELHLDKHLDKNCASMYHFFPVTHYSTALFASRVSFRSSSRRWKSATRLACYTFTTRRARPRRLSSPSTLIPYFPLFLIRLLQAPG